MVKHCLTVILKAHEHTNPGETPWVTADQPLYAFLTTIQWRFPETHGEDKLFGVLGALHIEKAAWTCVGQIAMVQVPRVSWQMLKLQRLVWRNHVSTVPIYLEHVI